MTDASELFAETGVDEVFNVTIGAEEADDGCFYSDVETVVNALGVELVLPPATLEALAKVLYGPSTTLSLNGPTFNGTDGICIKLATERYSG